MRRPVLLLTLALLPACSSNSSGIRVAGPTPEMAVPGVRGSLDSGRGVRTSNAHYNGSADVVWAALVRTYEQMGIPITTSDTDAMVLASAEQRLRSVGGRRVNEYVRCVESYGNGGSYDVYLTVFTALESDGAAATAARVQVAATAKPQTRSGRIPCTSTGLLEEAIAAKIGENLGQTPVQR